MTKPYRLFFSHGGDDTPVVKDWLRPKVEKTGATVFLDAGHIEYGDDFRKAVLEELAACDELLVLFTKSSLRRPWVLAEVGATLIREKRIVPIVYGPSEAKLQSRGVLSLLGTKEFLTLDDFDDYLTQLKARVDRHNHA